MNLFNKKRLRGYSSINYNGEFNAEGQAHGHGVENLNSWTSGSYEGQFKDGQKHGYGIIKGNYYRETLELYCGINYADGKNYEGEWKNNKQDGYGVEEFHYRNIYEGEFKDGYYHGKGVCRYHDRSVYEGEYKYHRRHGKGIYTDANGLVQNGNWEKDIFIN